MGPLLVTSLHLQLRSHRSLSLSPCFSTLVPKNSICSYFYLRQLVLGLFYRLDLLIFVFSNTLRHIQALGSCLLLGQFSVDFLSLWRPKGAHPYLQELFLHPMSIRNTSTSLRQSNLYPFRLLLRPVMPLLAFHIHLDLRFFILEPLIIFLVMRIFFLRLLLHHLYR